MLMGQMTMTNFLLPIDPALGPGPFSLSFRPFHALPLEPMPLVLRLRRSFVTHSTIIPPALCRLPSAAQTDSRQPDMSPILMLNWSRPFSSHTFHLGQIHICKPCLDYFIHEPSASNLIGQPVITQLLHNPSHLRLSSALLHFPRMKYQETHSG